MRTPLALALSLCRRSGVMVGGMNLEVVEISSLKPDPRNGRNHDLGVPELAASLVEFGQRKNLVVWHDIVISGNGLMLAAQSLGWTEMEIDRVPDDWTYEKAQAYALADNKTAELSSWDLPVLDEIRYELEAGGRAMEPFGFEPLKPPVFFGDKDPDEVPDIHDKAKSRLGDIYELGEHRLLCGDSTDEASYVRVMGGGVADLVFTDPPYGVGIVKGSSVGGGGPVGGRDGGGKIVKTTEYRPVIGDENTNVAVASFGVVNALNVRVQVWWGGNYYSSVLPNSSCWLVWDKENTGNFADAELAWTNQPTAVRIFKHMWNGMLRASERGAGVRVHPTQKPVALAAWAFEILKAGEVVLDPFGGSGSTLIACEQTGRKCRMIEIDPRYVDVIVKRWEDFTGQKATRKRS